MRALLIAMVWWWCCGMGVVVDGYVNLVLIGPVKDTYPLARHYSEFYNVPMLEKQIYFYPQRFVMISEENKQVEDTLTINVRDYPHHKQKKNPNYFISWVKQTTSSFSSSS